MKADRVDAGVKSRKYVCIRVSDTMAIGKKGASSRIVYVMRGCVTCFKRAGVRLRLKAVRGSNGVESLRSTHCHRQREPATCTV